MQRQNNFNLLRFLFAGLVILSHAPELRDGNRSSEFLTLLFGTISFGEFAVDSFFLISGYLIFMSWSGRKSAFHFFVNRVARIYPGFIVAALISVFLVGPMYAGAYYLNDVNWVQFVVGLLKLGLVGIPPVFTQNAHPNVNGAVWTIPYEFKCYLLVLILGGLGMMKHRYVWLLLFLLLSFVYLSPQVLALEHKLAYFRFGMAFVAGGCFFLYRDWIIWRRDLALLSFSLSLIGLSSELSELCLCIFFGYSMFYFGLNSTIFLPFNRLPDVSYGLYLYAWPINNAIIVDFPGVSLLQSMVAVLVLSIFCGLISWYLVERPSLQLKDFFMRN